MFGYEVFTWTKHIVVESIEWIFSDLKIIGGSAYKWYLQGPNFIATTNPISPSLILGIRFYGFLQTERQIKTKRFLCEKFNDGNAFRS